MNNTITDKVLAQLKTLYPHRSFGAAFNHVENSVIIKTDADLTLDDSELDLLARIAKGRVISNETTKRKKPHGYSARIIRIKGYFYGTN